MTVSENSLDKWPTELAQRFMPLPDLDGWCDERLLYLPAELFWFKGHFPAQPILPGVAQVHWILCYTLQRLGNAVVFQGIEVVKFQRPLLPDQSILLRLQWNGQKRLLEFNYAFYMQGVAQGWPDQHDSLVPVAASHGKIRWGATR